MLVGMLQDSDLVAFLPTTDLERAKRWFTDTIGLAFVEENPYACVFDSNGTPLRVTLVDDTLTPMPFTVLGWHVSDIAAAVDGLLERGVTFERFESMGQDDRSIWTTPGGDKVAWFKDPDGNLLSLTGDAGA